MVVFSMSFRMSRFSLRFPAQQRHPWLRPAIAPLLLAAYLTACGNATQTPAPPSDASDAATPVADATTLDPAFVIDNGGIGPARLGDTLGQLKAKLGDRATFSDPAPLVVDVDAIAVSIDGEVQFYVAFPAGEVPSDTMPIDLLVTDNPRYQTRAGVGPETAIATAATAYGAARLNYNTDNEGREYVAFPDAPPSLSFRTNGSPGSYIGRYGEASEDGSFYETTDYDPAGAIAAIWVSRGPDAAATSAPAADTAAATPAAAPKQSAPTRTNFAAADRALNDTYQALKAQTDPADFAELVPVQTTWLTVRDGSCAIVPAGDRDACLQIHTETRTTQLANLGQELGTITGTPGPALGSVTTPDGMTINCNDPQNTPEINYCSQVAYDRADAELNQLWQALTPQVSGTTKTTLVEAQQAWIRMRDGHCEFMVRGAVGGTGYSGYLSDCLASLTRDRSRELQWLIGSR